ncbi:MAG: transposase [Flavobacteriales bacterium]|nr:transposase [Flavobacteriales bacterium]
MMKLMGQWSKRHGVEVGKSLICLEATGHYTLMMLNLIVGQQWHAWLAHPNDIQQSMGIKRVKNDKVDALRIAQYARTFHEKARLFTAQNLKLDRLKHLITRRNHLVRSRAWRRTHHGPEPLYGPPAKDRVRTHRQAMIKLEDQLVAHVDALILPRSGPIHRPNGSTIGCAPYPALARSSPHTWWACTDGFARFNTPRQLSCHAGVAPFERSSGSSVRGRTRASHQA